MDDSLETAPCGYFTFRDDGTIESANRMMLEIVNREREEVVGEHVETILSEGARLFYHTHFFPLLKMQKEAEEIYLSFRRPSGTTVPCLLNAHRSPRTADAHGANGSHNGTEGRGAEDRQEEINEVAVLPFQDRNQYEDELLQARRAAEQASRAKDKFLSTVSHELRTPISTIMMLSELLQKGRRGSVTEQQKEDLTRIRSSAQYLHTLITDILDFARMEPGKTSVDLEPVGVAGIVERAETLLGPQFEANGLAFETAAVPPDLRAYADPDRVQQILLNLLTNAIKFTESGGRVSIEVDADDDRVRLHVRDTGIGISVDEQESIFDPFTQGARPMNRSGDGSIGLGLAISRDLARKMNGDLTVDSAPDEGSTFTLALPRPQSN